jgi:hypothetical protein
MLAKTCATLFGFVVLAVPTAAQQTASPGVASEFPPPGGQTAPPPAGVPIDVKRGDEWKYETRDFLTQEIKSKIRYVVADVLPAEIDVRLTYLDARNGRENSFLMQFDHDWQLLESPLLVFKDRTEPTSILEHLEIGKTWSYSYKSVQKTTGTAKTWYGKAKIVGWEKVILRSNRSFDAFKIERDETDEKPADGAVAPKAPSTANRTQVLRVVWFAPSENGFVREVSQTRVNGRLFDGYEQELLEYRRHQD